MSDKIIKISSNDPALLEKIHNNFQQEQLEINLEKVPVKGAMGFDVVINFNIDPVHIAAFIGMVKYCIIDKKCKLFLKKPNKEDEIIDAKLLDDPQNVIDREEKLQEFPGESIVYCHFSISIIDIPEKASFEFFVMKQKSMDN